LTTRGGRRSGDRDANFSCTAVKARDDGRFRTLLRSVAKADVRVDDFCLAPLTEEARRDLLEILDDRHGRRATVVAGQLPVGHWHAAIGEPTLADAILDRLVHNAYTITLKGESMRKRLAKKPEVGHN